MGGTLIALRILLLSLVGFGFFGSGRLAWREWTTGEACPVVGSVPACYVAFGGFSLMAISLITMTATTVSWTRRTFYAGVGITGGLALVGSILEVVKGNVCPRAGTVPMCFLSLAMSLVIGGLFWRVTGVGSDASSQGSRGDSRNPKE